MLAFIILQEHIIDWPRAPASNLIPVLQKTLPSWTSQRPVPLTDHVKAKPASLTCSLPGKNRWLFPGSTVTYLREGQPETSQRNEIVTTAPMTDTFIVMQYVAVVWSPAISSS